MIFVSVYLYKSICCGYSFELPQLVEAIHMSTHNICFYNKSRYKYKGCDLKTTKLLDCALIGVCAVIRLNTVTKSFFFFFSCFIFLHCLNMSVCLFDLGLTSLSTIFQSYRDGIWLWQGAQCSLLECCLTEISCPRHFDMIFHPVTLYWHWTDQFRFLALLS